MTGCSRGGSEWCVSSGPVVSPPGGPGPIPSRGAAASLAPSGPSSSHKTRNPSSVRKGRARAMFHSWLWTASSGRWSTPSQPGQAIAGSRNTSSTWRMSSLRRHASRSPGASARWTTGRRAYQASSGPRLLMTGSPAGTSRPSRAASVTIDCVVGTPRSRATARASAAPRAVWRPPHAIATPATAARSTRPAPGLTAPWGAREINPHSASSPAASPATRAGYR